MYTSTDISNMRSSRLSCSTATALSTYFSGTAVLLLLHCCTVCTAVLMCVVRSSTRQAGARLLTNYRDKYRCLYDSSSSSTPPDVAVASLFHLFVSYTAKKNCFVVTFLVVTHGCHAHTHTIYDTYVHIHICIYHSSSSVYDM